MGRTEPGGYSTGWTPPSYTVDVAAATASLISTGRFGLYHITNTGSCSWHEFASTIFRLAGPAVEVAPLTTQEFGAAARRPGYSVLATTAYESLGLPAPRSWTEALRAYLHERQQRR